MSFDRVAPYYDRLARLVFGSSIRRAQWHFLNHVPPTARVLLVGGGTGWLLPYLLEKQEVTHVTYLEASAVMLALAQRKAHGVRSFTTASIRWVHGNERQLASDDRYDVLITNFVLDMYAGAALHELMQQLLNHLHPAGCWLFTDFQLSGKRRHRWWQRMMAQTMYVFFHLTAGINRQKLPCYDRHFAALGLYLVREKTFFGDFIVSRVYQSSKPKE
jgi:ubiquinone/menaquinone biosynthesis C-methylase UbiE